MTIMEMVERISALYGQIVLVLCPLPLLGPTNMVNMASMFVTFIHQVSRSSLFIEISDYASVDQN